MEGGMGERDGREGRERGTGKRERGREGGMGERERGRDGREGEREGGRERERKEGRGEKTMSVHAYTNTNTSCWRKDGANLVVTDSAKGIQDLFTR